jgi:hypothetical protein
VVVREVNAAPVLDPIADQFIPAGTNFSLTISASDPDLPANKLTFNATSKPAAATLNAGTGVFSWTPLTSDLGTTNLVVVQVTDDGSPNLVDTISFNIVVGSKFEITSVVRDSSSVTLTWSSVSGQVYRVQFKDELGDTAWTNLPGDVTAAGATAVKQDTTVGPVSRRFYRIQAVR